jgi:ribosome maturation factor RimP
MSSGREETNGPPAHFLFLCCAIGMMQREILTAMLQPVVEELGYSLWEIECSPGKGSGLVRLYLDAEAGITVEDCARVSRAVSEVLDAEDPIPGEYTLEVSSPGLERPLRTAEHFGRFVGETVFVELAQPHEGRRRFLGLLTAADATTIEVEVDGQRHVLPVSGIRKAHLAPQA